MRDKLDKQIEHAATLDARARYLAPAEFQSVADIPYLHRQRILVVADDVAEATRPHLEHVSEDEASVLDRLRRRGSKIADESVAATLRAVQRMRAKDADVLLISRTEAAALTFSPSHPHLRTVYVAHPIITSQYFDAAHFHQHLLEGKFAELLRLLSALGAKDILIEQTEGRSSDSVLGGAVGALGLTGEARRRRKLFARSGAGWRGTLPGHKKPHLPEGELAWYPTEPLWQAIAEARVKYRQQQFDLELRHDQSYGVDAKLGAALKKAELEAGGELHRHESSAWRISGTFL